MTENVRHSRFCDKMNCVSHRGTYCPDPRTICNCDPERDAAPGDHCGRCCFLGRKSFAVGKRLTRFSDGKSYWYTFCEAHREYIPSMEEDERLDAAAGHEGSKFDLSDVGGE